MIAIKNLNNFKLKSILCLFDILVNLQGTNEIKEAESCIIFLFNTIFFKYKIHINMINYIFKIFENGGE